jgi:hypothetical protein
MKKIFLKCLVGIGLLSSMASANEWIGCVYDKK